MTGDLRRIVDAKAEAVAARLGVSIEEARELVLEAMKTKTVNPTHGTGH